MLSRWRLIEEMIREFQTLLSPSIPRLELEEGVDCESKVQSSALKKPGVYFIFDATEMLMYVGSASSEQMIQRTRTHLKSKERFQKSPRWIDIIPLEWDWFFIAPALELYLIQKIERSRLTMGGNKLMNKVGMIAGVREWFDLTYSSGDHPDEVDALST
jgi:hypothetical protein